MPRTTPRVKRKPVKRKPTKSTAKPVVAEIAEREIAVRTPSGILVDSTGTPYIDEDQADGRERNYLRGEDERKKINERLEQLRQMLSLNMTYSDVCRRAAKEWGVGFFVVYKNYLPIARKLNLEAIARSVEDTKSDSLSLWAQQQLAAKARMQEGTKLRQRGEALVDHANRIIDHYLSNPDDSTDEKLKKAAEMVESGAAMIDAGVKQHREGRQNLEAVQDRLDKLYGHHSPDIIINNPTINQDNRQVNINTNIPPNNTKLLEEVQGLLGLADPDAPPISDGVIEQSSTCDNIMEIVPDE